MKKFHKTVTPSPRSAFMKSLFRTLTVFLSTYQNDQTDQTEHTDQT